MFAKISLGVVVCQPVGEEAEAHKGWVSSLWIRAICNVYFAVCNMQYAMCTLQCVLCSVQYSMYNMQCVLCSVQYSMYNVYFAVCNIQCTICSVYFAMYNIRGEQQCSACISRWTLCNVLYWRSVRSCVCAPVKCAHVGHFCWEVVHIIQLVSSLIVVGGWMKAWVGEGVSLTWKQIIFQPTLLSPLPPLAVHLSTGPL